MTTTKFSATEIIDVAKQIEACGEAFYDAAVDAMREGPTRDVFVYLRNEEQQHAVIFERLLRSLELDSGDWRWDDDYIVYMRSLATKRVFPDEAAARAAVAELAGDQAAVEYAIQFERDTVTFFEGLAKAASHEAAETIGKIIEEERRHVATLEKLKEQRGSAR